MKINRIISRAQDFCPVKRYKGLKSLYLKSLNNKEKDICKTLDIPDKTYNKFKEYEKHGSIFKKIKIWVGLLYCDGHFKLFNTSFNGTQKPEAFFAALMQAKKGAAERVLKETYSYRLYEKIDNVDTGTPANIKKALLIPVNYLRYYIKSDKKLRPLMTKLSAIKGNGDEFTTQAYELITKHLRISDRAPKLVIDNNLKLYGEYYPTENVIKIRTNQKRKDIICTLRHEIEHFRQSDFIIRVLGIDEYAKIYPQVKPATIRKNFAGTISAPRIKLNQSNTDYLNNCVEAKKTYKQKGTWFDYYLNFIEVYARNKAEVYRKQFLLKDNITFLA